MTSQLTWLGFLVIAFLRSDNARGCQGLYSHRNVSFYCCCAEFEHLKTAEARERRRQTEHIVRLSLQVLLQHSFVRSYHVFPDITRKNRAPEEYYIYSIDLAAVIRTLR